MVFHGHSEFALFPLQSLIEHPGIEVTAVITHNPTKKQGRKQVMTPSPVKLFGQKEQYTDSSTEKVKDKGVCETDKGLEPDFIVLVAFGQIFYQKN